MTAKQKFFLLLSELAENCELTAIAGRTLEKAQQFKEKYTFQKAYGSYEELLEEKDVEAFS